MELVWSLREEFRRYGVIVVLGMLVSFSSFLVFFGKF